MTASHLYRTGWIAILLATASAGFAARTSEAGAQAPAQAQAAGPRNMSAVDLLDLQQASRPLPSPDGSETLYRVSRADWQQNKAVVELWRRARDAKAAPQRILADSGGHASWSPDGKTIAFVDKRDGDKVSQIYLLPAHGGEAQRLGELPTAPSDLVWTADGKALYFLADIPETKEQAARMEAKDDIVRFEAPGQRQALWQAHLASGKADKIIAGDFEVRDFDIPAKSGETILYRRAVSRLPDDQTHSELWLHTLGRPVESDRRLTDNDYQESQARMAPDGRSALFLANAKDGAYGTVNANLFVLDIASGAIRELAAGPNWAVEEAVWSADGKTVYFTAQAGVRTNLHAAPASGGAWRTLVAGDSVIASITLSRDGRTLAYSARTSRQPGEIFTINPDSPHPVQLSRLNDDITARFNLPKQEAIRWKAPDGQLLEGLLTYPIGYQPGKRYPLIVQNHGGPRVADQFDIFAYSRFLPLLTARGAMVLSVNYRGGTGYGDVFLQGMNAGYFRLADKDVLSGVDELIQRGLVDPDRLGMMGWSAGGHMTARLETVTNRFKAAVVGAGAVDWSSMYLLSDTRWQRKEWFVTPPYGTTARRDLYQDYSPLASADKVTTPTLILAGAEDERVPPVQSIMYYRALRELGVETELYLAPREPHNFRELRHRLFQINAQLGWFSRFVLEQNFTPDDAPSS